MTSIKSPLSLRDLIWLFLVAAMAVGWWTQYQNAEPMSPVPTVQRVPAIPTRYVLEVQDTTSLVTSYLRSWTEDGNWPKPGTFKSTNLIHVGTETDAISFPGRRRDFYRTSHEPSYQIDVIMWDDGRIGVKVIDETNCETC